jgi:AbrB family looped-hinge helix DNA binding protein
MKPTKPIKSSLPPISKKMRDSKEGCSGDGHLMGATVLGERGQLVIPKDIRERLKLKSGARLLVMNQEGGPIIIFPLEKMQSMLDMMTKQLTETLR